MFILRTHMPAVNDTIDRPLHDPFIAVADNSAKTSVTLTPEPSDAPRSTLHASTPTPSTFGLSQFVPRALGDYELLEEIARGGMGIVYKARQKSLNRIVAVKLLLFGELSSEAFIQRFRVEAQAAASLKHPNIVSIYEIGQEAGQHFFSMEYVEGQKLAELVRDKPLSAKKAAAYVKTIAEAIHSAHEKGILHRDLKPSNVLIDAEDRVRVTDFGLAKRLPKSSVEGRESRAGSGRSTLDTRLDLTVTGQVLGTPGYMAPEQCGAGTSTIRRRRREESLKSFSPEAGIGLAGAKKSVVGPWSDVYGLGAILYHLLTARPPFQAETLAETLHQVVNVEPVSPRLLNASVPVDLETICLKCLEKEPARRYSSADELVAELGRCLRDEPIQARPVSHAEKTWRWCRRNPALSGALSAALALLVVVSIGSPIALYRINQARKAAEAEKLTARQGEYASDMVLAQQALEANNRGRALQLLEKHRPRHGEADLRNWEWRYLWKLCQSDELTTVGQHDSYAAAPVIFAAGGAMLISSSHDGVKLWDVSHRRQLGALPQTENFEIYAQSVSADGTTLAGVKSLGAAGRQLALWDLVTQRELPFPVPCHSTSVVDVALSPTGRTIAISELDGKSITDSVWDLATKSLVLSLDPVLNDNGYLMFSPDGTILARLSRSRGIVVLRNLANRTSKELVTGHTDIVRNIAFSLDGRWLGTASYDGTAKIWEVASGRELAKLTNHLSLVFDVAFSPDGETLATASGDQTIKLWNTATWQELTTLRGHLHEVWDLAFSPDGRTLASGAKDGTVKLWSIVPKQTEIHRLPLPKDLYVLAGGWNRRLVLSPDGKTFLTINTNGVVTLWDSAKLSVAGSFQTSASGASRGAISSKRQLVAIAYEDGNVRLISGTGVELGVLKGHAKVVFGLAFSSDGTRLATGSLDQTVRIWDTTSTQQIATCDYATSTGALRFSDDSRLLAGGYRETVLWDVATGRPRDIFTGHKDWVNGFAFSPDGKTLVTASIDGTAKLWDLASKRLVDTLWSQLLAVNTAAFSPDGTRLATGEKSVKLWDVARRQEVATLTGHSDWVIATAFLDDDTIISASNNEVILWSAASFSEIAALEQIRQAERRR